MRIVVFSGTTEGRDFSRAAAALGIAVTVSVATDLGAEEQGQAPGITVHSGRLLPGAMAELLQGAALCVDATHPYAVEATKNIRAAANAAGVEYHRLLRAASTLPAGSVVLGSAAQAAQYLAATQGNVLLTTGAKELAAFAGLEELDVLINNAGICHYGLLSQTPQAVWDRIFAVNVRGAYLCTNAAMPLFLKRRRGAIINVSSMWGQVGASCEAAYSASKGAILALTKALAKELGPSGIRVNAVAPGVILTDMVAHVDPEVLDSLREETPLERNGRPEDVANAMVYLAGAEFITGQILPVNGGFVIT
jgi:NAD(P)-dependent dehydrogenase (short-subunit alcohol dehydrogenase family)